MELKKGDKIVEELMLLDEIVYYVEPSNYYDDGCRKIYKFIDENKNVYVWKTSKTIGLDYIDEKDEECFEFVDIGDKILMKGTVKDLNNYKGEDQIVITRCRVESIIKHQYFSEEQITKIKRDIQLSKITSSYTIKTVRYKTFKEEYSNCDTLIDSFVRNDKGCFIDVIIA